MRRKYYRNYRRFPPIKVMLFGIILLSIYFYNRPTEFYALLVFVTIALVIKYRFSNHNKVVNIKRCRNVADMLKTYKEHPTDFEKHVAALYKRKGYKVQVTQAVADGGKDLLLEKNGIKYAAEVKLYAPHNKIGRPLIQKLHSACIDTHRLGIFITTSSFTNEAIQYANKHNITLVNGYDLEKMAK